MAIDETSPASAGGSAAQQKAREAASGAKATAVSQLDSQKAAAARGLHQLAGTLQQSGMSMQMDGQGQLAQVVSRAGDQLEQVSRGLATKPISELVSDVEDFARRQPALFLGLSFAAGLAASRFLKSSDRGQSLMDRGAEMARSASSAATSSGAAEQRTTEEVAEPRPGSV